jgi:hypothetical protein
METAVEATAAPPRKGDVAGAGAGWRRRREGSGLASERRQIAGTHASALAGVRFGVEVFGDRGDRKPGQRLALLQALPKVNVCLTHRAGDCMSCKAHFAVTCSRLSHLSKAWGEKAQPAAGARIS